MSGAFFFENIIVIRNESGSSNTGSKPSNSCHYFIVIVDEEIERETTVYLKELELLYGKKKVLLAPSDSEKIDDHAQSEEELQATMKRLEIEKKIEDRRLRKMKQKHESQNLLFPDEKMLDLLSSDSNSGDETEEEGTQPSKKIKLEDGTEGL